VLLTAGVSTPHRQALSLAAAGRHLPPEEQRLIIQSPNNSTARQFLPTDCLTAQHHPRPAITGAVRTVDQCPNHHATPVTGLEPGIDLQPASGEVTALPSLRTLD